MNEWYFLKSNVTFCSASLVCCSLIQFSCSATGPSHSPNSLSRSIQKKKKWKTITPKLLFHDESSPYICGNCFHYYVCCSYVMNERWLLQHSPQGITEQSPIQNCVWRSSWFEIIDYLHEFRSSNQSMHPQHPTCHTLCNILPVFLVWLHLLNVHSISSPAIWFFTVSIKMNKWIE